MRFVCDSCRAQYMISDEKVGAKGVKVRCKKCGYVILVRRQDTGPRGETTTPGEPPPNNPNQDAIFKGVEDDEIGAVFDQVLSAASTSKGPQIDAAPPAPLGGEDDHESTRVVDVATMQKLAERSGEAGETEEPATQKIAVAVQHEWFVAIDEKQVGPLNLEKVKDHWDRGEVGPDSLCWRSGFSDWMALSEVDELATVLAPRPPKPVISIPVTTVPAAPPVESAFAAGAAAKPARSDIPVLAPEPQTEMDVAWKPSAASALASLVQDEMAALKAPAKVNGKTAHDAPVVATSLLDVPEGRPAPLPNMPPASEMPSPPVQNGYSSMSFGPAYVGPPPNRRGIMMAVLTGVGVAVVLLLGAAVFLLYQSSQNRPVGVATTSMAPTTVAAAPTSASPPAPAPPGNPSPGTSAVPSPGSTSPPVAVVAHNPAAAPTQVTPTTGIEPREPRGETRGQPGRGPRGPRSSRETPGHRSEASPGGPTPSVAPTGGADNTDDDFDTVFGRPAGSKPAAAAPPKPKQNDRIYIPPEPGKGGEPTMETLGKSDVMQVVFSHKPAIVKCVDEQRKREPGASGKLVIRWNVVPSGKVTNVVVQTEEMKTSFLAGCLTSLVKSWTFPRHRVQGEPIDFPFTF